LRSRSGQRVLGFATEHELSIETTMNDSFVHLAVITAFALSVFGCARAPPITSAPPMVEVAAPLERLIVDRDTFPGRFDAVESVEVRPRVNGYIDSVNFKDGDTVKKGDLLFVIDPRPYAAMVEEARGRLADARSHQILAGQELERAKILIATNTIAPDLFERREQTIRGAEAAVQVAEGALHEAELNLGYCRVSAPMAGRVSRHFVSAGNLVVGGAANATLLTTIVQTDPIDFYFDIDEGSYVRYNEQVQRGERTSTGGVGGNVLVTLTGTPDSSRSGLLDFVDNRLDRSTGTLHARARLENRDGALSPGQFGRAEIISSPSHKAVLVPENAIGLQSTGKVLEVVAKGEDRVVERPVVVGHSFGALREISSGLQAGDRVVIAGLQRIQAGDHVSPHDSPIDMTGFDRLEASR
jgi:RND family efflux transporter MFP subunit